MAKKCIDKDIAKMFLSELKKDKTLFKELIDVNKTSLDRENIFKSFIEDDALVKEMTARLEEKMASTQKDALKKYLVNMKKLSEKENTPRVNRIYSETLDRIEKNKNVFTLKDTENLLGDLARKKLGLELSDGEIQQIIDMRKIVDTTREVYDTKLKDLKESKAYKDAPLAEQTRMAYQVLPENSPERLAVGDAIGEMQKFVAESKLNLSKLSDPKFKERADLYLFHKAGQSLSLMKSILASTDLSFFGRQGMATLFSRDRDLWFKNFKKMISDIGVSSKENRIGGNALFGGEREDIVMRSVRARIYSDENYLNGAYSAAKNGYALGIMKEEAFATSLPEKLAVLGKAYKISENAFNAPALRLRQDLANRMIERASMAKLNPLDPKLATDMGRFVGALTGRSSLGKFESASGVLNNIFFSPRNTMSLIDRVTLASPYSKADPFVKKAAQRALASELAMIGSATILAYALNGKDSVEFDPRSSNFGKIKVGNTWVDISGGHASLAVISARIASVFGEAFGLLDASTKSTVTGEYKSLRSDEFGARDIVSVMGDFFQNKLAPAPSALKDFATGKMFGGKEWNAFDAIINSTQPLTVQKAYEVITEEDAMNIFKLIPEMFGFSTYEPSMVTKSTEWKEFREEHGDKVTNIASERAMDIFNSNYNSWVDEDGYNDLTDEEKSKKINELRKDAIEEALSESYD